MSGDVKDSDAIEQLDRDIYQLGRQEHLWKGWPSVSRAYATAKATLGAARAALAGDVPFAVGDRVTVEGWHGEVIEVNEPFVTVRPDCGIIGRWTGAASKVRKQDGQTP